MIFKYLFYYIGITKWNGMGMCAKSAFSWEYIHRKLSPEDVAKLRKQLIEEYHSGKFTDKELIER